MESGATSAAREWTRVFFLLREHIQPSFKVSMIKEDKFSVHDTFKPMEEVSKSQKRRRRRGKKSSDPALKAQAEAEQARHLYFEAELRRESDALLRREAEHAEAKCQRKTREKLGCTCCNNPLRKVFASERAKAILLETRAAWAAQAAQAL